MKQIIQMKRPDKGTYNILVQSSYSFYDIEDNGENKNQWRKQKQKRDYDPCYVWFSLFQ